jgi:hypothetical protein
MPGLEDIIRKAAPGGNISKPLMLALLALLASGALSKKADAGSSPSAAPQSSANEEAGGHSEGWAAC